MLMVHGSGSNFYASPSNQLAIWLRDKGITVGQFNTRGHDIVTDPSGGHKVGNANQLLSETHLDIKAAVDFLVQRGYSRVCIWGKSLGSVTVVIAQAKNQDPNVANVVALGALRFSHKCFSEGEMGEEQHPRMLNAGWDVHELTKDHANVRWKHFEGGGHSLTNMEGVMFETVLGWLGAKTGAVASV